MIDVFWIYSESSKSSDSSDSSKSSDSGDSSDSSDSSESSESSELSKASASVGRLSSYFLQSDLDSANILLFHKANKHGKTGVRTVKTG